MSTVKVVDIIDRAVVVLNDTTNVRWTKSELLLWFNDAQRAVVNRRPDSNSVNEDYVTAGQAAAANTKQTLPSTGLRLLKVVRNTDGAAVTHIRQDILDEQVRNWHDTSVPVTDVRHFIFDDRDPKSFYLYPAPATTHSVEIVYSVAPADISVSDFDTDVQTIALDDTFANALLDYMLYRAYSKDAEYAENAQRAQNHLQIFESALGMITQADMAASAIGQGMGQSPERR